MLWELYLKMRDAVLFIENEHSFLKNCFKFTASVIWFKVKGSAQVIQISDCSCMHIL